jgi:hypothetical protein
MVPALTVCAALVRAPASPTPFTDTGAAPRAISALPVTMAPTVPSSALVPTAAAQRAAVTASATMGSWEVDFARAAQGTGSRTAVLAAP